jgi:hypothetical protein
MPAPASRLAIASSPRRHRQERTLAALAAAALLGACEAPPTHTPVVDCDLNATACTFTPAGGQAATIEFTPRPLPLMQPIRIALTGVPGIDQATIDFDGVAMDMGFNRVTLVRDSTGTLHGTALLPVCATGAMRWRADLRIGEAPAAARFEFDSGGR